jgi:hypothetical protein
MTIAHPDLLLRGGRFVGSRGGKSGPGEFARIYRCRRSGDSFRNRPHGRPILSRPKENEGMSEGSLAIGMFTAATVWIVAEHGSSIALAAVKLLRFLYGIGLLM